MFKRGEQFVLRSWGMELKTGEVLSNDNVKEAHFSIAGQPDIVLNWGAHGAAGAKVFFWTNAWNIPPTFPLGTTTVHVVYTLESGVDRDLRLRHQHHPLTERRDTAMNLHMKMAVTVAALAGATMLLPALASGTPTPLVIPTLTGVAALPGPLAPAATPAASMTTLTTKPDVAVAGTKFTVSAKGLPAS